MPRQKKVETSPVSVSPERKVIDRARNYVSRLEALLRSSLSNLAPAAKLLRSGRAVTDTADVTAAADLSDECSELVDTLDMARAKLVRIAQGNHIETDDDSDA